MDAQKVAEAIKKITLKVEKTPVVDDKRLYFKVYVPDGVINEKKLVSGSLVEMTAIVSKEAGGFILQSFNITYPF